MDNFLKQIFDTVSTQNSWHCLRNILKTSLCNSGDSFHNSKNCLFIILERLLIMLENVFLDFSGDFTLFLTVSFLLWRMLFIILETVPLKFWGRSLYNAGDCLLIFIMLETVSSWKMDDICILRFLFVAADTTAVVRRV